MKNSFLPLIMLLGLVSCNNSNNTEVTHSPCVIDSVQYHGIGHDNTLQFTPYYYIHIKELNRWSKSPISHEKGDTIIVSTHKIKLVSTRRVNLRDRI